MGDTLIARNMSLPFDDNDRERGSIVEEGLQQYPEDPAASPDGRWIPRSLDPPGTPPPLTSMFYALWFVLIIGATDQTYTNMFDSIVPFDFRNHRNHRVQAIMYEHTGKKWSMPHHVTKHSGRRLL